MYTQFQSSSISLSLPTFPSLSSHTLHIPCFFNSSGFSIPAMVALNRWLHHNMDTVVSMYEDHFDLCTLESRPIDLPGNIQTGKQSWWKRLTQQNSKTVSPELHCIVISPLSMPVKRAKELRALIGWRYYFSLFLEFSDITMPLIKAIINKMSDAISFFLVSLIGGSLGLIYTGIRQSLRLK